jgi:transcriptional regulator with PAS, ATPase and Fis domain
MIEVNWSEEVPMAITVCDTLGTIIYMNERSKTTFSSDGGGNLVGKNIYDCHSLSSQDKIKHLLETNTSNIYTIKKNNKKKMIIQTPWFQNNTIMGLVEFSLELPETVPHFDRD